MTEQFYVNLNELGARAKRNAVSKGFYDKPCEFGTRVALMHSELSEALEADRKDLNDKHLPHRNAIEVELADCIIRILDCSEHMGLDIHGAVLEKMAFNEGREIMHGDKKY